MFFFVIAAAVKKWDTKATDHEISHTTVWQTISNMLLGGVVAEASKKQNRCVYNK